MYCYHCGCLLSEHNFCTNCGADVTLYKKLQAISNLLYNEGLEKAGVRDLSGAVSSLRQSLKFNKNNIEARNLLGLVYYEMGEVISALTEWVISKNIRPDKNIADDYIEKIQANGSRLDAINSTIKKYNQALACCQQGNKDVAIIQLKKVLSLNPRFIRAHQLLALLYMDSEQWERAERELNKCMDIDKNNTQTLRYLKETRKMLIPDENARPSVRKSDDSVRYVSDNEVIIQPVNVKEQKNSAVATLVNIAIGLFIGAAAVYFLVVPGVKTKINNEAQKTISEISNEADVKTARIKELESENAKLSDSVKSLQDELQGYVGESGSMEGYDELLVVVSDYLVTGDRQAATDSMNKIAESVNPEEASEGFKKLYSTMQGLITPELYDQYYLEGYNAYQAGNYTEAVTALEKADRYNTGNADGYFFLARAYHKTDNKEKAMEYYQKILDQCPDSNRADKASGYLADLKNNQ